MGAPQMTLTGCRVEVKELLTAAGLRGFDIAPERAQPPYAVVSWGDPVLEPGLTFGSHRAHLDVALYVKRGANSVMADAIDADLNKAVFALVDGGWTIDRVDQPVLVSDLPGQPIGIELSISAEIKLVKE